MESKLNALAIETYSSAFSDRVANDFFARQEKINGEQILQLSPVQQVNLFVIKNLFESWQQEASRLRSPYFNYSHPKVQEAQKVYMNTLSRHISVSEPDLKPLLKKAVQDSLVLTFAPITFLCRTLAPTEGRPQLVEEILRYVKVNQAYAKETKSILNRQNVSDNEWITALEKALLEQEKEGKLQPEPFSQSVKEYSNVLSLQPSEILREEEPKKEEAEEDTDFFSTITRSFKEQDADAPAEMQPTQEAPAPEADIPTAADPAPRHAQLRRDEPELSNKAPQVRVSQPENSEEKQQKTLNDRLKKDQGSLNQNFSKPAEKPPLASTIQANKKKGSIRSGITLNQRFMFTNELFKGNTQAFNEALDKLDSFGSYQEAKEFAFRQYAVPYNWDLESEASEEFLQIIQSRYA